MGGLGVQGDNWNGGGVEDVRCLRNGAMDVLAVRRTNGRRPLQAARLGPCC
jgi:hypothetical protein